MSTEESVAPDGGQIKQGSFNKADWAQLRGKVLQEAWEALRDAPGGPLIDAMHIITDLVGGPTPAPAGRLRHRRQLLTAQHLETVAVVYLEAQRESRAPTRAVADAFEVAHSTAAKWVGMARKQALIPVAEAPGIPGEPR